MRNLSFILANFGSIDAVHANAECVFGDAPLLERLGGLAAESVARYMPDSDSISVNYTFHETIYVAIVGKVVAGNVICGGELRNKIQRWQIENRSIIGAGGSPSGGINGHETGRGRGNDQGGCSHFLQKLPTGRGSRLLLD